VNLAVPTLHPTSDTRKVTRRDDLDTPLAPGRPPASQAASTRGRGCTEVRSVQPPGDHSSTSPDHTLSALTTVPALDLPDDRVSPCAGRRRGPPVPAAARLPPEGPPRSRSRSTHSPESTRAPPGLPPRRVQA